MRGKLPGELSRFFFSLTMSGSSDNFLLFPPLNFFFLKNQQRKSWLFAAPGESHSVFVAAVADHEFSDVGILSV